MRDTGPLFRDLVLLGGGHAHVIVIRRWAMNPLPGVRVTLVSPDALTPYSGMLPGLVAGHYTLEQTHIDLVRLCRWAGVRFVCDAACGVDADARRVLFDQRPSITYDLLSVDTGGAPRLDNVEGAAEFAIPVKPVSTFNDRWCELETRAGRSEEPMDIGVVGAGAGGFEILLAANHRLNGSGNSPVAAGSGVRHRLHWVIRGDLLGDYPRRVRRMGRNACIERGITLHDGFDVVSVRKDGLRAANGAFLDLDATLWCTEAMASSWPVESGLDCDDRGFVRISDSLQSLSDPRVFAAGDVAVQVDHPRPRAGVFAVRQGPVLADNLRRALLGQPLRSHRPQERFLTLLSQGDRSAIGNKGPFSFEGRWVWQWKHWIDNRFMFQFNELPDMPEVRPEKIPETFLEGMAGSGAEDGMRCGGCGAKVAADVLDAVIADLAITSRDDLEIGLRERGDVAVFKCRGGALAQSVDQLREFVSDPWLFGRIAAIHALSDLYAASARPQSAMVMVTLPWGDEALVQRELSQLMEGVVLELNRAGCALTGGHTAEGRELALGLVVNGVPSASQRAAHSAAGPGDRIILTKSIGTGVILAADMRARATGPALEVAIRNMLASNGPAAQVLVDHGVLAMTDVTGFGLLGHLVELLRPRGFHCRLDFPAVPVLAGAAALSQAGFRSSLYAANARFGRFSDLGEDLAAVGNGELLADPQTSGGLLAVVPEKNTEDCLVALHQAGVADAAEIGRLVESDSGQPVVTLR